ncbi:hypothetical protein D7X98_03705 [bacterium 1XD8-76]|nr:hypothetical protein D7X98_03705 [bacterium 1XD8-76]
MGALEIVLLAAGAVIFTASFCIPVKREKLKEETLDLAADEVRILVAEELESVRGKLTEILEEEMRQQIEKSERSMERISNEKIMAVNEYSDTVLDEIHKSHEEVVFLYDMMKNKKDSLSESYGKADQGLQELLQQVKDSEITVQESLQEISGKLNEFEKQRMELEAASQETARQVEAASQAVKQMEEASQTAARQMEAASQTAAKQMETASQTAAKQKTPAVRRARKAEENVAAPAKPAAESTPVPERKEPERKQINESPVFEPFTPEKIAAAPKKRVVRKAAEKQTEQPAPAAENADLMLLLSDTMENSTAQNSNERILVLHKAGKSNMAIARELGLGVGEVKLVIDLYEGLR